MLHYFASVEFAQVFLERPYITDSAFETSVTTWVLWCVPDVSFSSLQSILTDLSLTFNPVWYMYLGQDFAIYAWGHAEDRSDSVSRDIPRIRINDTIVSRQVIYTCAYATFIHLTTAWVRVINLTHELAHPCWTECHKYYGTCISQPDWKHSYYTMYMPVCPPARSTRE